MHLSHQLCRARETWIVFKVFGLEHGTRVIAIGFHSKVGQRQQVNPITFLQGFYIGIAYADTQHSSNHRPIASKSTHPCNVMITPLDIVIAHGGKHLQYFGGSWSAVKNITHDMPCVDGEVMNQIGHSYQQLLCPTSGDDTIYDGIEVARSIILDAGLIEQLLDDISEVLGQHLAHLRTGVFDGNASRDIQDLVYSSCIPLVDTNIRQRERFFIQSMLLHPSNTLIGIVNQRTQCSFFLFCNSISVDIIHLTTDNARCVFDHVDKGIGCAMKVANKMFGTFR